MGIRKVLFCALVALAAIISTVAAEPLHQPVTASRIVDLTHPMHEDMVYWPGGVPFSMARLVDYDQGYRLHKFEMGENTGTHVDAPSHFVPGGRSIDTIPLADLVAPIMVINVSDKAANDPDYQLTAEEVRMWEERHQRIPENSLVILNTGWHRKFDSPGDYINQDEEGVMHFPGYSGGAARLLAERDVAGIGIDTLSIDHGASTEFTAHSVMLEHNKYQIENLANLGALPPVGATAVVGVLPVKNGTQAQARVFALLP